MKRALSTLALLTCVVACTPALTWRASSDWMVRVGAACGADDANTSRYVSP